MTTDLENMDPTEVLLELQKQFGEIPQKDKDMIDALCDTFMEAVNCGDDVQLEKEVREVFTESLSISFYVGMIQGIASKVVVDCPLRSNECPKKEPAN